MKDIILITEVVAAGDIRYIPVPCRGIVHSIRLACDTEMVATGTLKVGRGDPTTAAYCVNTATVLTGNTAIGVILDGVKDTDYGDLVFDPDSSTAANRVLWIENDSTLVGGGATLAIRIRFNDSAYIEQEASEA